MSRAALRAQSGFAYIAAVVLLVVVAGLSVAVLRLTTTQQSTINQGLLGAQAGLAARGGVEWALASMTTRCPMTPGATIELSDFKVLSGFHVTVNCAYQPFDEGQRMVPPPPGGADQPTVQSFRKRLYRIEAVACNGGGTTCFANADGVAAAEYVERARVATVCVVEDLSGAVGGPCEG